MCLICRCNYCNNTAQRETQKPHFLHGCGGRPCPSLCGEEVGTELSWQVEPQPLSSVLTLYNQNTRVCLVILRLCLSHFHPALSLCTPGSLSFPIWGPSSHCPWLSLQHPFPWLASSAHFPPGPRMAPPRPPLIAQTSWFLSTPPAAAVPAQAHLSPSTHTRFSDPSHCRHWLIHTPGFRQLQVLLHLCSTSRSAAWLYPNGEGEEGNLHEVKYPVSLNSNIFLAQTRYWIHVGMTSMNYC